jgi:hypothetical protein
LAFSVSGGWVSSVYTEQERHLAFDRQRQNSEIQRVTNGSVKV